MISVTSRDRRERVHSVKCHAERHEALNGTLAVQSFRVATGPDLDVCDLEGLQLSEHIVVIPQPLDAAETKIHGVLLDSDVGVPELEDLGLLDPIEVALRSLQRAHIFLVLSCTSEHRGQVLSYVRHFIPAA